MLFSYIANKQFQCICVSSDLEVWSTKANGKNMLMHSLQKLCMAMPHGVVRSLILLRITKGKYLNEQYFSSIVSF